MKEKIRLQKYISNCGVMSRRKAEEAILAGRVLVNGVITQSLGSKVLGTDKVSVDGVLCIQPQQFSYLLLNKPEKVICTRFDPQGRKTVYDLIPSNLKTKLHTVGRLDFMSSGLMIMTDDGILTQKLTHPSHGVEKEYRVITDKKINENLLKKFKNTFSINGISYRIKTYKILNECEYTLTLTEGKNREIRNLFNLNHIGVKLLQRIRIGCVEIANLEPGNYRWLSEAEIDSLLETGVNDCSN